METPDIICHGLSAPSVASTIFWRTYLENVLAIESKGRLEEVFVSRFMREHSRLLPFFSRRYQRINLLFCRSYQFTEPVITSWRREINENHVAKTIRTQRGMASHYAVISFSLSLKRNVNGKATMCDAGWPSTHQVTIAFAFDEGAKLDVPIVAGGVMDSSSGNFCKYCRSTTITRSTAGFIVTFVFSNTVSTYLVQFH